MSSKTPVSPTASDSSGFVHLHLHTEYSLLDGGNRIDRLMDYIRKAGMEAVAITDHGNLFGAVEFYTKAKAAGVKPILGIEAYVAHGDRTERLYRGAGDGGYHLVLLAENQRGWENLLKLTSDSYRNGFYFKPRMDKSTLARWSDGLIAINGHLGSSLAHHLVEYVKTGEEAHYQAALQEARWHAETFSANQDGQPRFFVELQRHDTPLQHKINPELIRLARQLDLPLVCDNDAHFLRAEDHDTHDTICCISIAKTKDDQSRLKYAHDLYVKTPAEMAQLFHDDVPEALENTVKIARRCHVDLDFNSNYAPIVNPDVPDRSELPAYAGGDRTAWFKEYCAHFSLHPFDAQKEAGVTPGDLKEHCDQTLRLLCEAGLIWRYGPDGITDELRQRLDRELQILFDKLISAYFLIVWDFVNWARQNGIPAGARGSGVGTMVGYVLGLSNACPVKYGLLFERFTDPNRSEYPDIDVDICQDGRAAVIDYVRRKYGHVAQIITFGTLKARAAIKDVGRVLGFTPAETQHLCNLIPDTLHITLDEALAQEPELKKLYDDDPKIHRLLETARAIEGQVRNSGVHAAGVVVATQPLDTIIPLCRPTGPKAQDGEALTQWDGPTVEKMGLLKMDFLGSRTLSIIERCKKLIGESLSEDAIRAALGIDDADRDPLDLELLQYSDPRVFALFARGDTAGVFQFESAGMRNLLMEMKPDRLEDLIAANALYRPGPMELIPAYNRRKHGAEEVPRVHTIVDRCTAETYGVMVYQEQVMMICHELGGIPLRQAYTLIKAISKKNQSIINSQREVFIDGAVERGLERAKAEELFDLILSFAGYGFNKSHSTGYSIIAYQTAYLKTYFPNQYMAAVLTYESAAQKVANWIGYLDDCRKARFPDGHTGIEVRPPDVNLSNEDFAVVFDENEPHDENHGHVRFGLKALKGAGDKAICAIVKERRGNGTYRSLFDFCERVPLTAVNKATIEALIKAGAFDAIHSRESRAALVEAIESAVRAGQTLAADRAAGQASLFGPSSPNESSGSRPGRDQPVDPPLPHLKAWDPQEALAFEKEVLGFYVSNHPLDQWRNQLATFATTDTKRLQDVPDGTMIVIGGLVTRVRSTQVRRGRFAGQKMAMITLEDQHGSVDGVLFSADYAQFGELLQPEAVLLLVGEVDRSRGAVNIKVNQVVPIEQAATKLAGSIEIKIAGDDESASSTLKYLTGVLQRHAKLNGGGGRSVPVRLHVFGQSRHVTLEAGSLRVTATEDLLSDVRDLLGPEACRVMGCGVPSRGIGSST